MGVVPEAARSAPSGTESAGALRPIGAVARELGLTARAIRYYEERGLLRPAVRVKGADRLFDESDVQRLREIQRLRDVIGFSLAEVAALLDADDVRAQLRERFHAAGSEARTQILREAVALAERRLDIVDTKLVQVQAFREEEAARLQRLRDLLAAESRGDGSPAGEGAAPDVPRASRRVKDEKEAERSAQTSS
jgi:DNA-binding transcriptional MerR regulator